MTGFPVLSWRGRKAQKVARKLYSGLLKAALSPELYESGAGTDTFEGRAAMVTVHASLLVHRLRGMQIRAADELSRAVNALILDGFDAAYREKGVGDSSIARKVRKLAEQHSGLGRALMTAFGAGPADADADLDAILKRNAVSQPGEEALLAAYIQGAQAALSALPDAAVLEGEIDWPDLQ